jgi:catechol 2,3-dioxygenase-like lactoylglutathione lyase family enzyme
MEPRILGLHHITALAGNVLRTYDFYTRVLGLRLIKQTVDFDDPATCHLYFGNEAGTPVPFSHFSHGSIRFQAGPAPGRLPKPAILFPPAALISGSSVLCNWECATKCWLNASASPTSPFTTLMG